MNMFLSWNLFCQVRIRFLDDVHVFAVLKTSLIFNRFIITTHHEHTNVSNCFLNAIAFFFLQ